MDLNLLNRLLVQERASLEQLESRGAGVGDQSLDAGVAEELELDLQRSLALVDINRGGGGQGGQERQAGDELHVEGLLIGREEDLRIALLLMETATWRGEEPAL